MQTSPFHSSTAGKPSVFHNNLACDDGRQIEPVCWRAGNGGRGLCETCARLNAEGR
jgi:hypothetical protein